MRWPSLCEPGLLCWVEDFPFSGDAGELFDVALLEVVEVLPRLVEVLLEHDEGCGRFALKMRVKVEGRQRLSAIFTLERPELGLSETCLEGYLAAVWQRNESVVHQVPDFASVASQLEINQDFLARQV